MFLGVKASSLIQNPRPRNSSWYQSPKLLIFKCVNGYSSTSFSLSASNLHNLISIVSVKLNATNYLIWRMQIFPLIQSLKLMNHLTDDAPKPKILKESSESIPNPKFDERVNIDLLLCSWIIGTLSEEALGHVVGMNTAQEVWIGLEETYLQATKEKVHLRR